MPNSPTFEQVLKRQLKSIHAEIDRRRKRHLSFGRQESELLPFDRLKAAVQQELKTLENNDGRTTGS